jgi:hypothetical protein
MSTNVIQFTPSRPDTHVHVWIQPSGLFDIHDDLNLRGGRFIDHKSAFRFIRDEFGAHAKLVFRADAEREAA